MSRRLETLRCGYTTGACAAAAAKAAALALLTQAPVETVDIRLPDDEMVGFTLQSCEFDQFEATCSVVKDAGDDPDVTDGAEIRAAVRRTEQPGIRVEGGEGVGRVTKPGLDVPVGEAAINKVPRKMIAEAVGEIPPSLPLRKGGVFLPPFSKGDRGGFEVTISVPEGETIAKKTLNRRLGIVGGVSILGTTGIVIPYSVDAYQASIAQALDVAIANGCPEVVLTTGRRSEKYAQQNFPLPEEAFVLMGDFVGHAIEQCAARPIRRVIIWGMIGKLTKIANGDLYTNISDCRIDMGFLAQVARTCGVREPLLSQGLKAVTAHHFLKIVGEDRKGMICNRVCLLAARRCRAHGKGAFGVECVMSSYDGAVLGRAHDPQ